MIESIGMMRRGMDIGIVIGVTQVIIEMTTTIKFKTACSRCFRSGGSLSHCGGCFPHTRHICKQESDETFNVICDIALGCAVLISL
jgi:hypothetical protein